MAPIMDGPDDALNAGVYAARLDVNKRLARLMGVPLVGCASRRLNLAVSAHLAPHEDELEKLQTLMRKLRTIKQVVTLR
ncbi:hypothetical protein GQ600_10907 [Phytophthora cactorum]|nr:hypothetical protein GQ600_10907 [Phytophthora cactorum]